jgi:hypothetical protein
MRAVSIELKTALGLALGGLGTTYVGSHYDLRAVMFAGLAATAVALVMVFTNWNDL